MTEESGPEYTVQFRRPDGTFVILLRGVPYHVVQDDPLFDDVALAGAGAPFEPAPPEPDFAAQKIEAQRVLVGMISAVADGLTAGVPVAEMLSWATKEAAARAFVAGTPLSPYETAILQPEADLTGETLAQLSARIVARGDQYRMAISVMAGIRRTGEQAIGAATTPEELQLALGAAGAALQALASA